MGCSRVSEGCRHCYAERDAIRISGPGQKYEGVVKSTTDGPRWTGDVRLVEKDLDLPLRWKRPRRIFVNSMSDLFHEKVPDEWIDRIFAVMALCPQHTFQVLTKRPERMVKYLAVHSSGGFRYENLIDRIEEAATDFEACHANIDEALPGRRDRWPLPNVWLGVSVEDQATADERIPLLLQTPAAVRWVSFEPALGPVNVDPWLGYCTTSCVRFGEPTVLNTHLHPRIDWLVVGGESGPGARPFDLAWARSAIAQCRAAGVPVFVKQLGAHAIVEERDKGLTGTPRSVRMRRWETRDRKGGEMAEWPEDLRIQKYPREVASG